MTSFLLIVFILWRVSLFAAAYLSSLFLPFSPRFPYADVFLYPSGLPRFIWAFAGFDGVHYLTIAQKGYQAQFTQVFFPLYPLLLTIFSKILSFASPVLLGISLSSILFLVSFFIFCRLLFLDYRSPQIKWMVLFLAAFPASFFFGSLYTESLFLVFVLSSFYLARRKKWMAAGFIAALASLTRLAGIFLLPALLFEYYSQNKKRVNSAFSLVWLLVKSPVLYLVPLGLLVYMIFLQINFSDWLYFWHAQPVFGAQRSGSSVILLPQVFFRYLKIFASVPIKSLSFWIPVVEFLSTSLAIILLIAAHFQKVRLSYLIYSWFSLLVPPLTGTFSSMPRYISVIFPIFISLGLIKSKLFKSFILVVFFSLLLLLTALFTSGSWVS